MRTRAWVAVAVGLAGLAAPAAGQPADPAGRPDPSGFLLPPVSTAPVPLRPKAPPPRPADDGPIRRASAQDTAGDDLPPPRPPVTNTEPLRPIPPASRNRPAYPDDDYAPPPRRSAPRDDYDYAPPRRRPAPPREEDELPPPPRRAPPRDDYDTPTARRPAPRPQYDDDYPPPPRRPEPRYDDEPPPRAASLARPDGVRPVSSRDVDDARSAADADRRPPVDPYDYLRADDRRHRTDDVYQSTGLFGGKFTEALGDPANGRSALQSDHCFDTFVSPVTNPFLFEDPRSLTEVRPVFIYQNVPNGTNLFGGGHVSYLGVQGRVAFTERLSLVINKFGGVGLSSKNQVMFPDSTGFAEVWLGPKYTFLRNTESGAVMAGGVQFQIPIGSSSVYQHTGVLSVVPYWSYAQNFLRSRAGSFNGILNTGYSFSTNSARSDYYYMSAHVDYDVGGKHKIYPLAELNWFYYTKNGGSKLYTFEGRDLINFGSQASGSNLLTGALGARVKVFKSSEVGVAYEIPFGGQKDLFSSRWTLDFIWRY